MPTRSINHFRDQTFCSEQHQDYWMREQYGGLGVYQPLEDWELATKPKPDQPAPVTVAEAQAAMDRAVAALAEAKAKVQAAQRTVDGGAESAPDGGGIDEAADSAAQQEEDQPAPVRRGRGKRAS